MAKRTLTILGAVMALAAAGLATESPASAAPPPWAAVPACPGPAAKGTVRCHAWVLPHAKKSGGSSKHSGNTGTTIGGLSPATIKTAYNFPTSLTAGAGQTIAIVDAYDAPNAEKDLATFSTQWGLPQCTTRNGCFTKVNQAGGAALPSADSRWALEISLDIQWAHAIAPGAKILLVEANSSGFGDLNTAEDYANQHALYVSNSWGGGEFSGESTNDAHYGPGNVSAFVASGDGGYGAEYPSASPNVISVGGTTLGHTSTGYLDYGWTGSGGGCSASERATSAQAAFGGYAQANCGGMRATPDLALDADPNSGVAVYDSTPYNGQSGWFVVGGTSASTPMVAARAAITGQPVKPATVYGTSISFRDVTQGSNNGASCLPGYDLVTGRGAWIG
ncbi:MAG TPA: S53 family peptidase [Propionibacteriaceae bacterium]|nr:S53 family peptidase [Propionibacteriaceae bacterium]